MPKLIWGAAGSRYYEYGVDRGVLYPKLGRGVPWNGLVSVTEESQGGEVSGYYFDGVKYLDFVASETYSATLEAFASPKEFAVSEGSRQLSPGLYATQQPRTTFGFSYRTKVGNDTDGEDHGYKLHLVYNATASPSSMTHQSASDTPELSPRSWSIVTVPPLADGYRPTAHFAISTLEVDPAKLSDLEDILYGTNLANARLPTQAEVVALLSGD